MLPIHGASMDGHLEVVRFLWACDPSTVSVKDHVSWYIFDIVMMVVWDDFFLLLSSLFLSHL